MQRYTGRDTKTHTGNMTENTDKNINRYEGPGGKVRHRDGRFWRKARPTAKKSTDHTRRYRNNILTLKRLVNDSKEIAEATPKTQRQTTNSGYTCGGQMMFKE